MPLYGHELSETIDPLTAGLEFAVKLDKVNFVGRKTLLAVKAQPILSKRVGLRLGSRRIAREHSNVYAGTELIGQVTSGTFSPTLSNRSRWPISGVPMRPWEPRWKSIFEESERLPKSSHCRSTSE